MQMKQIKNKIQVWLRKILGVDEALKQENSELITIVVKLSQETDIFKRGYISIKEESEEQLQNIMILLGGCLAKYSNEEGRIFLEKDILEVSSEYISKYILKAETKPDGIELLFNIEEKEEELELNA